MITGHFTTALIPYGRNKNYPFFILLLLTQVQDLLIPVDLIIQKLGMQDFAILQMTYSHDLIPAAVMALVAGVGIYAFYKDRTLALWSIGLVVLHEICDLLAGFSHNVMGTNTAALGFDFYRNNQPIALVIEALLAMGCITYYAMKRKKEGEALSKGRLICLLCIVFIPIIGMLILSLTGNLFS